MARRCHLVEFTCEPSLGGFSLALGYLTASVRADPVLAATYEVRSDVHMQSSDFDGLAERLFAGWDAAPDVVGFSIYFWSRRVSFEIARRVKERWPACTIVVGGNDVTSQGEQVLGEAPAVDVVVHGEGERTFPELLRALLDGPGALREVDGISFRDRAGGVVSTPPRERIADLAEIPSPFLTGVYAPELLARSRLLVFETNRGCPFHCAFCYWGGATNSKVRRFDLDRVQAELDFIFEHVPAHSSIFIVDANFGMLKRDHEIAEWLVGLVDRHAKPVIVSANWAKNTNRKVVATARLLYEHGLTGSVTLSAQSFDPEVLRIAQRKNIPASYYEDLQRSFQASNIPTYTELIWGLPGETLDSFERGVERVVSTGGTPLVYPLLLLTNTAYTLPEVRAEHRLRTREMPYRFSSPEALGEFVVEHARMTEDEWIDGLTLAQSAAIFGRALAPLLLWYLHLRTGARFVDMARTLGDMLSEPDGPSPTASALFRNFAASYRDPDAYDRAAIEAEIGASIFMDNPHFQAIVTHVLRDPPVAAAIVEAAAQRAVASLPDERRPAADELAAVVAFQQQMIMGWQASLRRVPVRLRLSLPADVARLLVDAGQLEVTGPLPAAGGVDLQLLVLPSYRPWDVTLMALFNGVLRSRNAFGALHSEPASAVAVAG